MARRWIGIAGLAVIAAGLAGGVVTFTPPIAEAEVEGGVPQGDPGRGAYLARMSGCIACHTDTKGGGAPVAGGAPIVTKFGSFTPPNISSDKADGVGGWTVADFARAVRQGVSPSGTPYYPAFPYDSFAGFSDQDVADLWAAFRTVPPAKGGRTGHDLGFPWSMREGLYVWRLLFFDPDRFRPDPERSEQWNRGAYIVNVAGHCGACHTPRNVLGGPETERALTGGVVDIDKTVPSIAAADLTARGWDEAAVATALRTGLTPKGDVLGGGMAEVIKQGTAWLDADDRRAIAVYLLSEK